MRMRLYDTLTDDMVGIQLQPSLSLRQRDSASGGAASASSLKSLLQASVMVGLLPDLLSTVELGAAGGGCYGGQIALANIHSHHRGQPLGGGSGGFNLDGYQQVEPF